MSRSTLMDAEYDTDSSGNQIYPASPNGGEMYRRTTDIASVFAKRDGKPYYAKDEQGHEVYPRLPHDPYADVPIDHNGYKLYAKKDDELFYPQDSLGHQFTLKADDGTPIYIHNTDGSVKYPLNGWGDPIYPVDVDNNEMYALGLHQIMSIGKNSRNNIIYAKMNTDTRKREGYYPSDGQIGYRLDDTPIYACIANDEDFIYPRDEHGNEYYLKSKHSGTDYLYYGYNSLNKLNRYARDNQNNEVYPVKVVDGGKVIQVLLTERDFDLKLYAVTSQGQVIYPLDEYNNEYTVMRDMPTQFVFPIGYPITHDRYVIVPAFRGKPFFLHPSSNRPISVTGNSVTDTDIRFVLPRYPSTDYLTDVVADREPRIKVGLPYVTEPLRDLRAYTTDASGNQHYPKDEHNNELYYETDDVSKLFAIRDGEPYYAKTADQSEFYPVVHGVEVLLTEYGKKPKYAKSFNGAELYPRYPTDTRDIVILEGDIPIYAKNEQGQFFYPKRGPEQEFVTNAHFIYETDGSVRYPKWDGLAYYPKDEGVELYGQNRDGTYAFLKNPDTGRERYARITDIDTGYGIDYYPADNSCIYFRGTNQPMYALDGIRNPIFPKNHDQDEFYLKFKGSLDDGIYQDEGKIAVLPRYATDHLGNEIYPVKFIVETKSFTEIILNNVYAVNAQNEYFYPTDEYNNEYTKKRNVTLSDIENFPLGYPQTFDNFIIVVPGRKAKPYTVDAFLPPVPHTSTKFYVLERFFSTDYVTDIQSNHRTSRITTAGSTPYTRGKLYYASTQPKTQVPTTRGPTAPNYRKLLLPYLCTTFFVFLILLMWYK